MLDRHVLVLNQSYEPLGVCNVRSAVILLYLGKAEIIERLDHRYLRSMSMQIPVPSIVRLLLYKRVPIRRIVLSRKNILIRDGYQCQYCGKKNVPLTVDHIVPRDQGGSVNWENLVCACVQCNNKKGSRGLEKAGMTLLRIPRKPTYVSFLHYFVGTINEKWKPYLFIN